MGIVQFTFIDLIDIWIVALLFFQIYLLTRGTNAFRIVVGILIVYLLWVVVRMMQMELLGMILGQFIGVGVIALIVVFQQEIRRFLTLLGTQYAQRRVSLFGRVFNNQKRDVDLDWIDPIVNACSDMAATKTGALIVLERAINLQPIVDKGIVLDARISSALIRNIFFKNSPMHDGAMVIVNQRIVAASCMLPSTDRADVPADFGTRHRAALGASEVTDALVIVVSEERGAISVARKGHISQMTPVQLRSFLRRMMALQRV